MKKITWLILILLLLGACGEAQPPLDDEPETTPEATAVVTIVPEVDTIVPTDTPTALPAATETAVSPTIPATNTAVPPTNTPIPATNTPIPQPTQEEAAPPPPPPAEGCVDINHAGREDLKRIIHIDDVRVEDLIRHRPYTSVDQLTRISGIAAGRLADIKAQGLACV